MKHVIKRNPALPMGGWSRQTTRDSVALHIACVGLLLGIIALLFFVAVQP